MVIKNNKMIILVEDSIDDIILTKRVFKKHNIKNELIVIRDGAEALDILIGNGSYPGKEEGFLPSLIILDINLPKYSGLEILEKLRKDDRYKIVPVVILTSSKEENDLIKGYDLGANSFVRKPVVFEEFSIAVGQLGFYWLMINESLEN